MNNTDKTSMVLFESTYKTMELILTNDADWREAMTGLLRFGFYGEQPQSDNPLVQAIYVSSIPSMQNARERWTKSVENGRKGGRPTEVPIEEILDMKSKGMTNKGIADKFGCSEKNIEKRLSTYKKTHPTNPTNPYVSVSVSEYEYVSDSVSDSDDVTAAAGDGRRQKKRGVKELSLQESIDLLQAIANKVKFSELMEKYNLAYIDKEAIQAHYNSLAFQPKKTESFEYFEPTPRVNTNTRTPLADIEDSLFDDDEI